MKRAAQGFTLVELLVAMVIFGIVMAYSISALTTNLQFNRRTELRGEAIAVTRQLLEGLRRSSITSLPATRTVQTSNVTYNGRTYNVNTTYCADTTYCAGSARQVRVEVSYGSSSLYSAETVFTALQ